MTSTKVRARFAPSPTGYLHVGGARTALFNFLFCRHGDGAFVLRIEDTDVRRNVEGAEDKLLEDLRWLGVVWDEGPGVGGDFGPYRQSERRELYDAACRQLLDSGIAYYAFDTPEQLDAMRREASRAKRNFRYPRPKTFPNQGHAEKARADGLPVVVRFKIPDHDVEVRDEILGTVRFPVNEMDDFVIVKSNGWPTYHFAVVVDDAAMEITHVLRAQEHLMNTSRHVLLQQALGYPIPKYAHLPLVFNMDGSKMSKRDTEAVYVHDFRAEGYLPEALANFIALIGWSPGDDREKMSLDEMARAFSLDRVGKTAGRFDRDKLLAMNTLWGADLPLDRLTEAFRDYLEVGQSALRSMMDDDITRQVLVACKGFRTLRDVETKVAPLFAPDDEVVYDPKAVRKVLEKKEGRGWKTLERLAPELEALTPWSAEGLEKLIARFCEQHELKLGDVAQPLRVAVTGRTISPAIYDTLTILGKDKTANRIRRCLDRRATEAS